MILLLPISGKLDPLESSGRGQSIDTSQLPGDTPYLSGSGSAGAH